MREKSCHGAPAGAQHANMDTRSDCDTGRGSRTRPDRRSKPHRRAGRRRGPVIALRHDFRCRAVRGHSGADQCASPLFPDLDPRSSGGDQQGALSVAEGALSGVGSAPRRRQFPARRSSRLDRALDVRLHHGIRPPVRLWTRHGRCGGHRGRRSLAARHAHHGRARRDQPEPARRRPRRRTPDAAP